MGSAISTETSSGESGFLGSRPGLVATAVLIAAAIGTAFIGSGALFGTPVAEAAGGWLDEDSTWLAPASAAFRIWSAIYLGLVAYGVWQFLPAAKNARHRAARAWILAGVLLNSVWLWVVQAGWLSLSVLVIAALLACLCRVLVILERTRPENWSERIVLDGVQGLYLGWVAIAAITNVAAWLGSLGWAGEPLGPIPWTIVMLVAATLVGVALAVYTRGRFAPSLALAWGLTWVAVGRAGGTALESTTVAITAGSAAVVVLMATVLCWWLSRHHDER